MPLSRNNKNHRNIALAITSSIFSPLRNDLPPKVLSKMSTSEQGEAKILAAPQ